MWEFTYKYDSNRLVVSVLVSVCVGHFSSLPINCNFILRIDRV